MMAEAHIIYSIHEPQAALSQTGNEAKSGPPTFHRPIYDYICRFIYMNIPIYIYTYRRACKNIWCYSLKSHVVFMK